MPGSRWQYVVANIGTFDANTRLPAVLGHLGALGFELVTVYDKASNWFSGYEKGFMLFKREVPAGEEPTGPWCAVFDVATLRMQDAVMTEHGFPEGQAW